MHANLHMPSIRCAMMMFLNKELTSFPTLIRIAPVSISAPVPLLEERVSPRSLPPGCETSGSVASWRIPLWTGNVRDADVLIACTVPALLRLYNAGESESTEIKLPLYSKSVDGNILLFHISLSCVCETAVREQIFIDYPVPAERYLAMLVTFEKQENASTLSYHTYRP